MKNLGYSPLICICMVVTAIAATYSTLHLVGFANPDDPWALLKNPLVPSLSLSSSYWKTLAISVNGAQYSPLNTLYFALIYKINGFDPYYYHFASLVVHFINALLVFILANEILGLFHVENSKEISYLTMLFWAISPINVESVVWISASKVVLTTCFSLIGTIAFTKYFRGNAKYGHVVCVIGFILAFLCKEQALVLPITLVAMVVCYRFFNTSYTVPKGVYFLFVVLGILMILFAYVTLHINMTPKGVLIAKYPIYQRLILVCYSLMFYLWSLIVPVGLHYHYPFPMMPGQKLPLIYCVFPVLLIIIVSLGFKYLKGLSSNFLYLFCAMAFFINIGLCLHIVPMERTALMADRYMYIPSVFLLLIFCTIAVNFIYEKLAVKNQRIVLAISLIYLFALIGYSNVLVYNWTKIYLQTI